MKNNFTSPFNVGDDVIAYLRDSGNANQELSVSQQETEIRAFCVDHGLILQRTYIDAERQGSNDIKRDKLAEMMHDLRRHMQVAGVIVWSNSRFARNSLHAQFYRAEIRKLGYIFHSMTGKTVEGPESIIFEALEDYKNERFLTDLSIDVKRGLHALVRDYGCVPGSAPVGFLRELVVIDQHRDGKTRSGHRWIPDPLIAPRVLQAFEMRIRGASLDEINKETHLYKSMNGFRTFFCNPIYKGTLTFGDDIVIENYCEPMVDKDTWEAVQVIQNHYTRYRNMPGGGKLHPRRVASKYLLSGIIHCGRCGSPLFGRTHPQKNGSKMTSYYCTQAYNQRNCTKQRIPGALVEKIVIQEIKNTWLKPESLEAAQAAIIAKSNVRRAETQAKRAQAVIELAELRRQITNMTVAIAEGGHSRAMLNRLADLEHQETEKQNKIAVFDEQLLKEDVPTVDPERASKLIQFLDEALPKVDIQIQRRILSGFVTRVDVDRDGRRIFGTITVNYPPADPDDILNVLPPREKNPLGGKTVRMKTQVSGPPRYTHSFGFETKTSNLSGRYKKTH